MKVLIINNAEKSIEDFTRPIEIILNTLQVSSETIHYRETTHDNLNDYKAAILSASPFGNDIVDNHSGYYHWIKDSAKPILGICAGHHIIGKLFGSELIRNRESEVGECVLFIDEADPLFNGYKEKFLVRQNHKDSITLPDHFTLLAHSERCTVQVMKHRSKPIYTTQFHAELSNEKLLKNFIAIAKKSNN